MFDQLPPELQKIYKRDPQLHRTACLAMNGGKTYPEMLEVCVLLMYEQKERVVDQLLAYMQERRITGVHVRGAFGSGQLRTPRDKQATRSGLLALAEQATGTKRVFDVAEHLKGREFFLVQLSQRSKPMTFEGCRQLVVSPLGIPINAYRLSVYLNELISDGLVRENESADGLDTYEVTP